MPQKVQLVQHPVDLLPDFSGLRTELYLGRLLLSSKFLNFPDYFFYSSFSNLSFCPKNIWGFFCSKDIEAASILPLYKTLQESMGWGWRKETDVHFLAPRDVRESL